jgi:predicted methyltransferase MtxX (methanogen marker protein 4)
MTSITCFHVKHAVEGIPENAAFKCISVVCSPSLTHAVHNYRPVTFDTARCMLHKHYPKHQPTEAQYVTFIVFKTFNGEIILN